MKLRLVSTLVILSLFMTQDAWSEQFNPTTGTVSWDEPLNWTPQSVPNSATASATLPTASGTMIINLNQPTTLGSLTTNSPLVSTSVSDITIQGSATNTLTFDNGGGSPTFTNGNSSGGVMIIEAPIVFNSTLTINQSDQDGLRLMQPMSGTGGLNITRLGGSGVIAITGANTYQGPTVLTGQAGQNFLLVRLNSTTSIPGGIDSNGAGKNLTLADSVILGLRADDFKRTIGTGDGQFQYTGGSNKQNGWAAFIENRAVNIGGASAQVTWNQTNFNPNTFVLGHSTADKTIDFQNPLSLTTSGTVNRTIRIIDGTAPIDAMISGGITSPGGSTTNLTFLDSGTVRLTGLNGNTYLAGSTTVNSAVVIFGNDNDTFAPGNLIITNNGTVGLGAGNFTRGLGTNPGEVQFTSTSGKSGGGWAAYGADRFVNLGGASAQVVWGTGGTTGFIGTVAGSSGPLVLSADSADAMVDFQNPIDLNGGERTFQVDDGSAPVDAKVSRVITGSGGSILKGHAGTLELSAANDYGGTTKIQAGVLLLTNANSIPGGIIGGNTNTISFTSIANNGAVLGLGNGNFTSDLGSGAGKVQFNGTFGYGFAAYGLPNDPDRSVNLGGASAEVAWGLNNFISGSFILSDVGANKMLDFQNPIDLNGAVRTFDVRDGTANVDGLLSGVLRGAGGGLTKIGTGTLKLIGANDYNGGTTVSAGRLLVSNTGGSGTGTGAVTVNSGGTLGGTGTISGAITVNAGGNIAPGESVGHLTTGAVTMADNSHLAVELSGATTDLLTINGALDLSSSLDNLDFSGSASGAGPWVFATYTGSLGGNTFNVVSGLTGPLAGYTVDYSVSGQIQLLAPPGTPGDHNGDTLVNAADYVTWRKDPAGHGGDNGYATWRENFSQAAELDAPSLGGPLAVPEPAAMSLVMFAVGSVFLTSKRVFRRK